MFFITATVLQVSPGRLLVRDMSNGQEIIVNFANAANFAPGDMIRITSSGQMTPSIPPQITATAIERLSGLIPQPPQTEASQMRAVILQRRNNSLLVRNLSNNSQVLVLTQFASHFCPGQRILIRYETIRLSNPPQIDATEILPIC